MNLRKVDFFWINRDQRSFEWFVNLLSQLEIEQAELGGAMERYKTEYKIQCKSINFIRQFKKNLF